MKKASILMIAVILTFVSQMAFAGQWGRGMGMGYEMGPGMGPGYCMSLQGASYLGLTTEQSQKLQSIWEAYLRDITPIRNQLFNKRAELRLLWSEANPNKERIVAKQREINDLQGQIEEKTTHYRFECLNVLTPDQKAKLTTFGPGAGWGHHGPGYGYGPGYGHGPGWGMKGRW